VTAGEHSPRLLGAAIAGLSLLVPAIRAQSTGARDLFHASAPGPAKAPHARQTAAPLGLRYSIVKQVTGGQTAEVDPEAVFHSGDRIRLAIESNDDGYLYIIQRGSTGNWSLLFPSPEIAGGDNRIERGKHYLIPPGYWFAFDEEPGNEKLFIVLSRPPETNLEQMIYSLQRDQPKTLLADASRPIDDTVVDRIRGEAATRDLLFEKTAAPAGAAKKEKEKAVYVVDPSGRPDSRVVADIALQHK
jgi:hypothetical protein